MKALVYHGPGQRGWDTVPDPTIVALEGEALSLA
jgi:Alcohol dehydrogenase GroES-associated